MALTKPNTESTQINSSIDDEVNTLWLSAFDFSGDIKQQIQNSVGEYSHLDRNINRLPQFKYNQELLECLSQFTLQEKTFQIIGDLGEQLRKGKDNIKYEIIIENQRGATVFGSKVYTQQQLFYPVDPPKFQTLSGMKLQSLELYPEPNKNWKWVWDKWHVLMINDVDENGWIYSKVRFNSKHWTSAGHFGKFARRRIWIRMMRKEHENSTIVQEEELETTLSVLMPAKEFNKPKKWLFQSNDKSLLSASEREHVNPNSQHKVIENHSENVFSSINIPSNIHDEEIESHGLNIEEKNSEGRELSNSKLPLELRLANYKTAAASHNQHIRHMYFEVSSCIDDAHKTEKLLYFLSHLKNEILLFLIEDFELCQNKSNSWVYKILHKFHVPASRRLFLNRFQHDIIDNIDVNSENGSSLKQLYGICDDAIINEKV